MKPDEQLEEWRERVELALDQLDEVHPKALSASADLLSEFVDRFKGRPEFIDSVLGDRRAAIINRLLEIGETDNQYVLSASLGALARLGSTQGGGLAERAMQSANPYVREAGIRLFGLTASDSDISKLEPLLDDPHRPASVAAVRAVGRRAWKPALPMLLRILDNRREQARQLFGQRLPRRGEIEPLLQTIVGFMGKEAVPLLLEIASHDVSLRSYAVHQLVSLDVPETAPVLAHLLNDASRTLRLEVLSLLHKANYRQALPLVRPLLDNSESTLRAKALEIVTEWRDADALDHLERMARCETNPILRVKAISLLVDLAGARCESTLLELVGDSNTRVRQTIAECLGRLPSFSQLAITTLNYLAQGDADESVREAAHRALIGQKDGVEPATAGPLASVDAIPVPPELLAELPGLIEKLKRWRQHLPSLTASRSVEEIHALDSSLGCIIDAAGDALHSTGWVSESDTSSRTD